jgi:hypothetical protein
VVPGGAGRASWVFVTKRTSRVEPTVVVTEGVVTSSVVPARKAEAFTGLVGWTPV